MIHTPPFTATIGAIIYHSPIFRDQGSFNVWHLQVTAAFPFLASSKSPFTIQSHAYRHHRLSDLEAALFCPPAPQTPPYAAAPPLQSIAAAFPFQRLISTAPALTAQIYAAFPIFWTQPAS